VSPTPLLQGEKGHLGQKKPSTWPPYFHGSLATKHAFYHIKDDFGAILPNGCGHTGNSAFTRKKGNL